MFDGIIHAYNSYRFNHSFNVWFIIYFLCIGQDIFWSKINSDKFKKQGTLLHQNIIIFQQSDPTEVTKMAE